MEHTHASGPGWWYAFSAGSITHLAMILGFLAAVAAVTLAARRLRGNPWLPPLEYAMIAALAAIALVVVGKDLLPGSTAEHPLPLQVCDVVGLLAPVALLTKRRGCRAVLHFSALTLAVQGLIFPPLRIGPAFFDFWLHFIGHGAIVGAAIYDSIARGFLPRPRDLTTVVAVYAIYATVVFAVNVDTGLNYGYLGNRSHPVVDPFGAWPGRVATMTLAASAVACLLMAAYAAAARCRRFVSAPASRAAMPLRRVIPPLPRRAA